MGPGERLRQQSEVACSGQRAERKRGCTAPVGAPTRQPSGSADAARRVAHLLLQPRGASARLSRKGGQEGQIQALGLSQRMAALLQHV